MKGEEGRRRPLIGVTGPDDNHRISWACIALNLRMSGARMVRLTPRAPHHFLEIDGLIISGGKDIDPVFYGKEKKEHYIYDHPRDALEMAWVHHALKCRMPMLGICRGMQMINVCLNGTLYTDIKLVCEKAAYPNTIWSKVFARKPVVVKDGTLTYRLMGRQAVMVNSLHKQSLDKIGEGLELTAWEHNGIVQAVEGRDMPFLIGVQWHPEFMLNSRRQRGIFRLLTREARRYRRECFNRS